ECEFHGSYSLKTHLLLRWLARRPLLHWSSLRRKHECVKRRNNCLRYLLIAGSHRTTGHSNARSSVLRSATLAEFVRCKRLGAAQVFGCHAHVELDFFPAMKTLARRVA